MREPPRRFLFLIIIVNLILTGSLTVQASTPEEYAGLLTQYSELISRIRTEESFEINLPGGTNLEFRYELSQAEPMFAEPLFAEISGFSESSFYRLFWQKIFLYPNSFLIFGQEQVPLTCIFIEGQDNRASGTHTPLLPELILKVYLVANDFTCTGPINPGWPGNGGRREAWSTYLYFEVRDPTIMLPTEILLRYRWNEFHSILADAGGPLP